MYSLTIVIPTFNREELLSRVLHSYLAQSAVQSIRELIVVDDGSTDNTAAMVEEVGGRTPFEIRYIRQDKKGPAAARNLGIRAARGNLILFTDSDVVPDRDLVRQHLDWHAKNPEVATAILGYVTWPDTPPPTPFMKWYGEYGALFGYRFLRHGRRASFGYFYTCNVSLKTEFLKNNGQFDEEFKLAAYEDTELGYRLQSAGMSLLYNSSAVGYHYQFFSFASACQRTRAGEVARRLFAQKEAGKSLRDFNSFYRPAKWLAAIVEPVVKPFAGILDSHLPLPSFVYRIFWYYGTRTD